MALLGSSHSRDLISSSIGKRHEDADTAMCSAGQQRLRERASIAQIRGKHCGLKQFLRLFRSSLGSKDWRLCSVWNVVTVEPIGIRLLKPDPLHSRFSSLRRLWDWDLSWLTA